MAHFEAKWIGFISLIIKCSLAIGCLYLMFQRDSYQIFDRSPISAVTVKVRQASSCTANSSIRKYFRNYQCSKTLFDVNDYILPATENSAVSITTRIVETEHTLKYCNESRLSKNNFFSFHQCESRARCILPPFYQFDEFHHDRFDNSSLCWFNNPFINIRFNYEALDYIIFIKHFIEFPQLGLIRHNLLSNVLTDDYIKTCEYDPHKHPLCPKFRLIKILELIESNPTEYELMFDYGSLIEIKISWKCNLDRSIKYCEPIYEFERLDIQPYDENPYEPGSNFLTSRHFFQPQDRQLYRIHKQIYNFHIIISVTGEAGRFDLFQTTTSIGSFLGIFGTGAIVCDLLATFIVNFERVKYEN